LRSGPVDAAINDVMDEMIGASFLGDDTAVLAVRRSGPPVDGTDPPGQVTPLRP
jgi:hypothetical protein